MKLKSYLSKTVEAAADRPADPDPAASTASLTRVGRLAQEIEALRREFDRVTQVFLDESREEASAGAPPPVESPIDSDLQDRLLAQELDPALARAVAGGQPLNDLLEVDATLGSPGAASAIVALVGPPGAGKTTTLAKLAARHQLTSRRPIQILSADIYRTGAADQLRSLASLFGIGCAIARTPDELARLIEQHGSPQESEELLLIDTPGLAPAEMEAAADLVQLIASHAAIDTHLVLPAFVRPADLNRIIHRYSIFQPDKLLFTRVDETSPHGAWIGRAAAWSIPVSFLGTGQQIPDDLEAASSARLAELILGTQEARRRPGSGASLAERGKWAVA